MRLPFWADYQYRISGREKMTGFVVLGWLAIAAAVLFLVVPQARHYLELGDLVRTVESRVAAAEENGPWASVSDHSGGLVPAEAAAAFRFSSGAGIEAVTDVCATEGMTIAGFRPFRPDGESAVPAEALELKLEGSYPGVKNVLRWLEDGPLRAEIRYLEVTSGTGKVLAAVQAVQQVNPAADASDTDLVFEERVDIFADKPAVGEENKSLYQEAN